MNAQPRIRFYFDFISPYAYLAWTQIHALADRHHREIEPIPVLFAGLLKAHGQLGPAEIPAKARWMHGNVLRRAQALGVAIAPPHSHPFNPLPALRAASLDVPADQRRVLIDALFHALWVDAQDAADPATVAAAAKVAKIDSALLGHAQHEEIKARLRRQTEAAIQSGVFGVPTFVLDETLFWGCDELADLDRVLRGDNPLDPHSLAAWGRIQPSAQRRG